MLPRSFKQLGLGESNTNVISQELINKELIVDLFSSS
jgi:hypothetical protein